MGSQYCRSNLKNGGTCIYIRDTLSYTNINLDKYAKEQDIEICVIQLKAQKKFVIILCLYRVPSGNMESFLKTLDKILASLHKPKNEFIICGDININYIERSNNKMRLENLLMTYNLRHTVHFPTRFTDKSVPVIDNIFVDISRNYAIKPLINGLSDHDAQIISILNFSTPEAYDDTSYIRISNKEAVMDFQHQLSWERWEGVFGSNDCNSMFNNFLNMYLQYYCACFRKKKFKSHAIISNG